MPLGPIHLGAPAPSPLDPVVAAKLRRATEEFEAVFIEALVRQMNTTTLEDDESKNAFAGKELYRSMTEDALGRTLAEARSLGIADLLYAQFARALAARGNETTPSVLREAHLAPTIHEEGRVPLERRLAPQEESG
jgi:Rod binding domain-containing protein